MIDINADTVSTAICNAIFLFVYIALSGSLVIMNKYLLERGHFPHPMALNAMQMSSCIVFTNALYFTMPQLFPSMVETKGRRWEVFRWFVPLGALAAITLYCGNMALMWCSVAFVQFMKEGNVVMIFVFSYLVGLQLLSRQRLFTLVWIMLGAALCVTGELHFAMAGFLFQLASQVSDSTRAVMAEWVLGSKELKVDPLTYTMFIAPVSLFALVIGNWITWKPAVLIDLQVWWPMIIPNVLVAFCLNVMIAAVIQKTSAVGLTLTGIIKDMVLVVYSSFVFNDPISGRQWLSFCITITGVFFWSYMNMAPEDPAVLFLTKLLGGTLPASLEKDINEKTALLPGKRV